MDYYTVFYLEISSMHFVFFSIIKKKYAYNGLMKWSDFFFASRICMYKQTSVFYLHICDWILKEIIQLWNDCNLVLVDKRMKPKKKNEIEKEKKKEI